MPALARVGDRIRLLCITRCAIHCHMLRDVPSHAAIFENLRIELRSGCLTLAALAQLRVEHYAATLRVALADAGLDIQENTIYPLLRRLEIQGLLVSEWKLDGGRRKRFYRLSREGDRLLDDLTDEWRAIHGALARLLPRTPPR
jgi:PadR family transcriptional regulator PadR